MIDLLTSARNWMLQGSSPIPVALGGARIYRGKLPGGENTFDPEDGAGIVLSLSGGQAHPEIKPLTSPRLSVRVWALTLQEAMDVYRSVFDWLHGRNMVDLGVDGFVISCFEESQPQALTDPDSGWETILAFYDLKVRDIFEDAGEPIEGEVLLVDGGIF